jgi:hypothetical protein
MGPALGHTEIILQNQVFISAYAHNLPVKIPRKNKKKNCRETDKTYEQAESVRITLAARFCSFP